MNIMNLSEKKIDFKRIPQITLADGSKVPSIGLGTFGSDSVDHETVATTVKKAIYSGYRHIDCASVYGNEAHIGRVLNDLFSSNFIKREDLWITSKVWNNMHGQVAESCRQTLKDLQIDYLNLYLVHWPFPNYHPPKCDVSSRNPDENMAADGKTGGGRVGKAHWNFEHDHSQTQTAVERCPD
jgi:alcohol dehydrogenase (NADP+)